MQKEGSSEPTEPHQEFWREMYLTIVLFQAKILARIVDRARR